MTLPIEEVSDAPLSGMVGMHPAMRAMYRKVRLVAPTFLPVLVQGETGTGKELIARSLHELGLNPGGPWIDVNCAAIPDSIAESELFGAEKGAYTDAKERRCGLLEQADGGALFLDEAGDLSTAIQAKLLRAIERGEFRRVGSGPVVRVQFRLIVATSIPVLELLRNGGYRSDFFYRVAGMLVLVPPLRDRGADIRRLAEWSLLGAIRQGAHLHTWTEEALDSLAGHPWPGNVRELEMVVRRLALIAPRQAITADDVTLALGVLPSISSFDEEAALRTVHACQGNLSQAARSLSVPRSTLRDRLRHRLDGAR